MARRSRRVATTARAIYWGEFRAIVGLKVVVAAELDPHSHLTKKRAAIAAFEFPHTDLFERAEYAVDLALRAVRGDIRPVMAAFGCRMIDIFPTSREPMPAPA